MLVNTTGRERTLNITGADLSDAQAHMVDERHLLSVAFETEKIKNNTVLLIEW